MWMTIVREISPNKTITMKGKQIAILAIAVFGIGVVASFFNYGAYAILLSGVVALVFALTDSGKTVGVTSKTKDAKNILMVVGIVLIGSSFMNFNQVTNPYNQAINLVLGGLQGMGQGAVAPTSPTGGGGGRIIAATGTMTITAENVLNRTVEAINPSGKYRTSATSGWVSLSFSSGKATISSLDPYATISRIAVGTDASYYWEIQDGVAMGGDLSPTKSFYLVPVTAQFNLTLYDTLYNAIGYDTGQTGMSNQTVGSGGTLQGFARLEATGTYSGYRTPIICLEYNTTAMDYCEFPQLSLADTTPTRLFTVTNGRTIERCYDTGFDYMVDAGSKAGLKNSLYGFKDYQWKCVYLGGIDPTNFAGNAVKFYVADRDKYYTSPANTLFALDPEKGTSDLGSTTEWSGTAFAA